jgi:hypothetical protein
MPCFALWGKEMSSSEKVLNSAGNDLSRDTTEGKEVSMWIGIGSLVSGVMDFMEYVFVGTRTWKSSSQDEEVKGGSSQC